MTKKIPKELKELSKLQGISDATISKIYSAGIISLEHLTHYRRNDLMEKCGIGEKTASRLLIEANKKVHKYKTAREIYEQERTRTRLTTGVKELDRILGGGIEMRNITEFFGEYGTAKTQIMCQLAINALLPKEQGGLGGNVIYYDTENTNGLPERLIQMGKRYNLSEDDILDKIYIVKILNTDHQMRSIEHLPQLIEELKIKLVIVDSLTKKYRHEYQGQGQLATRQQAISKFMAYLNLAMEMNYSHGDDVTAVITNQIYQKLTMYGDPTTAVGGSVVAHNSKHRIYLKRKLSAGEWVAKIIDSPTLRVDEALFTVKEGGLYDI
jgi:DNA repair protein RadA